MSSVEDSLVRLLDMPGVTGVALVDAVTGLTYGEVGTYGGDAVESSQLVTHICDQLHMAGAQGLEHIVVTGAQCQVILRCLPREGYPLLLTATLDRRQANLALVLHQLDLYADGGAG